VVVAMMSCELVLDDSIYSHGSELTAVQHLQSKIKVVKKCLRVVIFMVLYNFLKTFNEDEMAQGLPSKIVDGIEKDVKKADKAAKTPWSGFGPIAHARMAPANDMAVIVWREASSTEAGRTTMMVGIFVKVEGVWRRSKVSPGNYHDSNAKIDVDQLVKKATASWKELATA
jgi:hypothetical protein